MAALDQRLGSISDPPSPRLGLVVINLPGVSLTQSKHLDASGDARILVPFGATLPLAEQRVVIEGDPRRADACRVTRSRPFHCDQGVPYSDDIVWSDPDGETSWATDEQIVLWVQQAHDLHPVVVAIHGREGSLPAA